MITAYFSSVLEDSVEIFFIDVTCIVIKAATRNFYSVKTSNIGSDIIIKIYSKV